MASWVVGYIFANIHCVTDAAASHHGNSIPHICHRLCLSYFRFCLGRCETRTCVHNSDNCVQICGAKKTVCVKTCPNDLR